MQVSHCVLPEISTSNNERRTWRICQATDLSIVQAERTGRNSGTECTTGTCASGIVDTAEVCSISVHGLSEGEVSDPIVSTVRKIRAMVLGASLWARGYCVSTIGMDEEKIRKYVQWQEKQEKQAELMQGKLFD